MNIEALPSGIATLGRIGIDEWTAVWFEAGIYPGPVRRTEIESKLKAMLCPHQAGGRFVYRHPAQHQGAADPVIVGHDY